ncbi:hypothetical protein Ndes2526B_g01671 [Nannochloris sp. 'desiccata']|nr:putative Fanconi-associated nuclease 1-like protein [Chlorella desiccata (nom. nud.)]
MRGTGSLQQLLGRSTFTSSLRKRKAEDAEASASDAVEDVCPSTAVVAAPSSSPWQPTAAVESPLKTGFVRCPVCQRQLEHRHGDELINAHLDKCLLKATTVRNATKQQATMLLFAHQGTKLSSPINSDSSGSANATAPALAPSTRPDAEDEEEDAEVIVIDDDDDEESWGIPSISPTTNTETTTRGNSSPLPSQQHQRQEQQQQQQEEPPQLQVTSCLVGRQFQKGSSAVQLRLGDCLAVKHEANNPRDRNALLVCREEPLSAPSTAPVATATATTNKNSATPSIALGHIPAVVAKHLGPLVRQEIASIVAVVVEKSTKLALPLSAASSSFVSGSVPLKLKITPILPPPSSAEVSTNAALAMIRRAVSAAATASATTGGGGAGVGRGSGGDTVDAISTTSGDRLRCNFKALVSTVCQHDAHVLAEEEELSFLKKYESASTPAQCLFLRLSQRVGPLFRIHTLSYAEVPDPLAAAMELHKLGLVALNSSSTTRSRTAAEVQWSEVADVLPVPELQAVLSRLMVTNTNKNGDKNHASTSKKSKLNKEKNTSKKSATGFLAPPLTTRPAVLAALQRRAEAPSSRAAVLRELLSTTGPVLKILSPSYTALQRLQRLFFLNEGHSLGQFLATDAGVVKYPSYPLTRQSPAFPTRDHFLRYEIALQQAETLTTALEEGDLEAAEAAVAPAWAALDAGQHKEHSPSSNNQNQQKNDIFIKPHLNNPFFLRRYDSAWVYCMMATAGVSILEKQKRFRDAADRLQQLLGGNCCPSRRGTWWLRLSTDLEHLGRSNDALEIGEAALADESLSPGDRLALQRRVLRLGKPPRRWKKPSWATAAQREPREVRITGRPLSNQTGVKSRFYGYDGEQCSVEELALQFYASSAGGEFTGAHTEGGIWATLFGLLLWPQLFSLPVPDAFRTPFQTHPLDLDSDGFYTARIPEIEEKLSMIASGAAPALIASIWEEHLGTLCRGVNWERWSVEELQVVASCVGGPGLAAVCRLLAQDHGGWQGGMPDLLLWHPERQEAKLVEVKGPRDRLSDQQRAWIAALEDAGLFVEVLKVVEPK